tara:strand:+ start:324 stop:500 length:177 start_codon:yes stop_codon:yes gene_type:complete
MGINSLFWEERYWGECQNPKTVPFNRYYFSPVLGQLRLVKPAEMRGGLLCDEVKKIDV